MKNLAVLVLFLLFSCAVFAQKAAVMSFGKIDTADLRMTSCDFEKGATAEVLFDKADDYACADSVVMDRHRRIKLFKAYDQDLATIKLPYYTYHGFEKITGLEAETINLVDNHIVITRIDPKLIYTQVIDKSRSMLVFTFPGVKEGSVIEYRYHWKTTSPANLPPWAFQGAIPTRYSAMEATMNSEVLYNTIKKGYQPFLIDTLEALSVENGINKIRKYTWVKNNVHSMVAEPFVNVGKINFQCLLFQLHALIKDQKSFQQSSDDKWYKIARGVYMEEGFGDQLDVDVSKGSVLTDYAKKLKTDDEKIAYLFNQVKNTVKWNNSDAWYTVDGVRKAWSKQTGNSTEINLILYNLLKKSGVYACPMVVSTRENGAISSSYASFSEINKTIVFVPAANGSNEYVLDASGKYNLYNEVPAELLNTRGLMLEKKNGQLTARLLFLKNEKPALQAIVINGEISPDSRLTGAVSMSNYSYNRVMYKSLYDYLGEEKYKEALTDGDNKLKISGLQFENMQADSLPLVQKFEFKKDLGGSDEQYIYVNPNQFGPLKTNPFLSEERFSDIDFNSCNYYTISGTYKLPTGYKVDVIPKNISLNMADQSVTFKRFANQVDGVLEVSFRITYNRSLFTVEEYKGLYDFYKKMFEMMNEPVVLKKAS